MHGPLREIPADALVDYLLDATLLVGDVHDLKHFVPRLLADVALDRADDVALYLSRFRYLDWRAWPDDERAVVTATLDVAWQRALATWEPLSRVEEVLCGVGCVLGDLAPLLGAWGRRTDPAALAALAQVVLANAAALHEGGELGDPWWEPEPMAQVVAWLRDPARRAQLASYEPCGDERDAAVAAAASVLAGR